MKTPDEIKKSLECMKKAFDEKCDFKCDRCPVYVPGYKNTSMSVDALAYIRQLEAELETAKRERDAAVKDLWYSGECFDCKYRNNATIEYTKFNTLHDLFGSKVALFKKLLHEFFIIFSSILKKSLSRSFSISS